MNNVRWKFYAWKFTFHFDFFPTDLSTSGYEQNSWALGFVLFVFGHQRELGRVRSVFSRSAKSELWVAVDIGIKPLVSIASPISLLCLINSNSAGIDRKVRLFCQRHIKTSNFAVTKSKDWDFYLLLPIFIQNTNNRIWMFILISRVLYFIFISHDKSQYFVFVLYFIFIYHIKSL